MLQLKSKILEAGHENLPHKLFVDTEEVLDALGNLSVSEFCSRLDIPRHIGLDFWRLNFIYAILHCSEYLINRSC